MEYHLIKDFQKAKHFYNKVKNKDALQEFLNLTYNLCAQYKIANYRFAIKDKEIMLIIGMRTVLNFNKKNNTIFIGCIINNNFLSEIPELSEETEDLYTYGGKDNKSFITLNYATFTKYKTKLIAHVQSIILEELNKIKGHSKEYWNNTASTTSNSFKHIVSNNITPQTYFTMKEVIFKNIKELITLINTELDDFCYTFQSTRKKLMGKKRMNATNSLFILNDETRDWSINEGGGIELQYHIFLRNNKIGFGLGFNTQYVPYANDLTPVEYMQPYINSYLAQKEVQQILSNNDFRFIIGSKEQLQNIEENQYILLGKEFDLDLNQDNYSLHTAYFNQLLFDIKNVLFQSYQQIISNIDNYKNYSSNMQNIIDILNAKKQIILQGPPGTGKTRLAKQIAEELIYPKNIFDILTINETLNTATKLPFKIIEINHKIGFIKILRASKEYTINFKEILHCVSNQGWKDKIGNWNESNNASYLIPLAQLFDERKKTYYKEQFNIIQFHPSYTYEDFVRGITVKNNASEQIEYKTENKILAQMAFDALNNPSKNYVLIIDEINRANLSSVLGELIYALEYRGEAVESMYEINENREIILPPNLFIIGTMNTADRSVGQIDYAIRRRFAFVDVLPKVLDESQLNSNKKREDAELFFAKDYFIEVSKLFIKNNIEEISEDTILERSEHLSDEFEPKDVWLGHSYFIYENDFNLKLEYEIKPILREYVTDGVLKESALKTINGLSVTND